MGYVFGVGNPTSQFFTLLDTCPIVQLCHSANTLTRRHENNFHTHQLLRVDGGHRVYK